jgi:hypothetical protein
MESITMINISLNLKDEQIRKLQYIQEQTNLDLSELVSRNISALIDEHYQQLQPQSPLQIFEELGLVGCINAEPNFSSNYKTVVLGYLNKKGEQNSL